MNANSDTAKRRVLAAFLALFALVVLAAAIARARPAVTTAQSQQPTVAVVKLPGGGTRTILVRPAHATTQTSGRGRTQLVSTIGPGGKVVMAPAGGGGDR